MSRKHWVLGSLALLAQRASPDAFKEYGDREARRLKDAAERFAVEAPAKDIPKAFMPLSIQPGAAKPIWQAWTEASRSNVKTWAATNRERVLIRGGLEFRVANPSIATPCLYILDGLAQGALPLSPDKGTQADFMPLMDAMGLNLSWVADKMNTSRQTLYNAYPSSIRWRAAVWLLGSGFPVDERFSEW